LRNGIVASRSSDMKTVVSAIRFRRSAVTRRLRLLPEEIGRDGVLRLHPQQREGVGDFGLLVRQQPARRDGGVDDESHQ
jgi:hypothetical protein